MQTPTDIETRTTGSAEEAVSDSLDVAAAVALLGDPASAAGSRDESDESGDDEADQPPQEGQASEEAEGGEAEPPEFWIAEDKAAWKAVPAELRPILKKYEQQRVEFVNEKTREAAAIRTQAVQDVQRVNAVFDQAAAWWQQAAPGLQRAFADKWSQVNWNELAEKNPAEWARLNQQRMDEAALLAEANRRGQADIQAANARAEQAHQQARNAEHAKLAGKLPDYFGTPDAARKTYDEIGRFLFSKGIPADRINAIYEAPIIELALNAWRFEQAQQQLALRNSSGTKEGNGTAKPTPTRVVPGPALRAGNRNADAMRQVGERFRRSGGTSIADAAELIRLSGL